MEQSAEIVYEDEHCFVVNKPPGVAVNSTHTSKTSSLIEYFQEKKPFAVHRLDRDTSGVMVFGKTKKGAAKLSQAFAERRVDKLYLAVVEGRVSQQRIEQPLGQDRRRPRARMVRDDGQYALTEIESLTEGPGYTLVRARPLTGRTHQIRVHLSYAGTPILGDLLYGGSRAIRTDHGTFRPDRYLLHALQLRIEVQPGLRTFTVLPPPDFLPFTDGLAESKIVGLP